MPLTETFQLNHMRNAQVEAHHAAAIRSRLAAGQTVPLERAAASRNSRESISVSSVSSETAGRLSIDVASRSAVYSAERA